MSWIFVVAVEVTKFKARKQQIKNNARDGVLRVWILIICFAMCAVLTEHTRTSANIFRRSGHVYACAAHTQSLIVLQQLAAVDVDLDLLQSAALGLRHEPRKADKRYHDDGEEAKECLASTDGVC